MEVNTFKVMNISTVHITDWDYICLKEEVLEKSPLVYDVDYGFLLFVGDGDLGLDNLSRALRNIIIIAFENDCLWIMIDQDGTVYDELPTYNWED